MEYFLYMVGLLLCVLILLGLVAVMVAIGALVVPWVTGTAVVVMLIGAILACLVCCLSGVVKKIWRVLRSWSNWQSVWLLVIFIVSETIILWGAFWIDEQNCFPEALAVCRGWVRHVFWIAAHLLLPVFLLYRVRKGGVMLKMQGNREGLQRVWQNEVQLCLFSLLLVLCVCLYVGNIVGAHVLAAVVGCVVLIGILWLLFTCKPSENKVSVRQINEDAGIPENLKDALHRDYSFNKLCRWIDENSDARIIGVFGRWGSGKTFLLHYLAQKLEQHSIVSVNLWQCSTEKELREQVLKALEMAYFGGNLPTTRLWRFLGLIRMAGVDVYDLPGLITKSLNVLYPTEKSKISAFRKAAKDRRVILMLDNVERTEINILHTFLPLVERLHSVKGLTIVISVATDVWNASMGKQAGEAHMFRGAIQKIVEYPYYLPVMKQSVARDFLRKKLREEDVPLDGFSMMLANELQFDTPRQVVRVAQAMAICEHVLLMHFKVAKSGIRTREDLFTYARPVLLLSVLRSQYESMYTILYEQSHTWTPRAPLPDLTKSAEGKVEEQTSEKESDSWYVDMLRQYTARSGNNEERYRILAKDVLDYVHDLLFSSVVARLNRETAEGVLSVITQSYAYNDEMNLIMAMQLVDCLQGDSHVKDCLVEMLELSADTDVDSFILAFTKYVIGFVLTSIREAAQDTDGFILVFMKLVAEHEDLLFSHLNQEMNEMIGPVSTDYLLCYACKSDKCMEQFKNFVMQLTNNSKAWVYTALRRLARIEEKPEKKPAPHEKTVCANLSLFKPLMDELKPIYESELKKMLRR